MWEGRLVSFRVNKERESNWGAFVRMGEMCREDEGRRRGGGADLVRAVEMCREDEGRRRGAGADLVRRANLAVLTNSRLRYYGQMVT